MKIISHREYKEEIHYERYFEFVDLEGAGFSFDCDAAGNVKDPSHVSYVKCLTGSITTTDDNKTHQVVDRGVKEYNRSYTIPAVGECVCGAEVVLYGFTNTCEKCNRDYNGSGQLLCDRRFWGEETFESLSDILSIDSCSTDELFDDNF